MRLTRGYTFNLAELLTNTKLATLVSGAGLVAPVNASELTLAGAVYVQTASTASLGWITAEYEAPLTGLHPAGSSYSGVYSDLNYTIQGPTGKVALFKSGGLETRRFVYFGPTTNYELGAGLHASTASTGVTLCCFFEAGNAFTYGLRTILGVNSHQTATTSPTLATGVPRLTLRGACGMYGENTAPATGRDTFYRGSDAGFGLFRSTSSSLLDGIYALELTDLRSINSVRPGFIWGGPLWRR